LAACSGVCGGVGAVCPSAGLAISEAAVDSKPSLIHARCDVIAITPSSVATL
jgi:hypothetical protein